MYTIYPWPCPRWTYWAFVGLLFKFHASRCSQYASLASVAVRTRRRAKPSTTARALRHRTTSCFAVPREPRALITSVGRRMRYLREKARSNDGDDDATTTTTEKQLLPLSSRLSMSTNFPTRRAQKGGPSAAVLAATPQKCRSCSTKSRPFGPITPFTLRATKLMTNRHRTNHWGATRTTEVPVRTSESWMTTEERKQLA